MRWALVLLALCLGCGAATELNLDPASDGGSLDAAVPDTSRADSSRPDTSRPDTSRPDMGTDSRPPDTRVDMPASDAPGLRCQRDDDCVGACGLDRTVTSADRAPASLTCGDESMRMTDQLECDDSGDCLRGLCVVAGVCVAPCVSSMECGAGEVCAPVNVRIGARTNTLNACVLEIASPHLESVVDTRVALGGSLELAARTERQTVLTVAIGDFAPLEATSLRARDGSLLFNLFRLDRRWPNPVGTLEGDVIVQVPSGPAAPAAEGYNVFFSPEAGRPELLSARVVTLSGETPGGGVIDLDIFYVGSRLSPEADGSLPRFVRTMLEDAGRILEVADIRFGETRQHVVPGELGAELAVIPIGEEGEPRPGLARLFRLSAGSTRPSMAVFITRELEGLLGVAGGIPGPWAIHGTSKSGVALSGDLLIGGGVGVSAGSVLAHEAGHFMGLYHTTEFAGFVIEPIEDTPECMDTDGDEMVLPSECPDGGRNLMFWFPQSDDLSAGQREQLQHALLLSR